jgi:hypothetical protein
MCVYRNKCVGICNTSVGTYNKRTRTCNRSVDTCNKPAGTCDDPSAPDVGGIGDAHEEKVALCLLLAVERLRVHRDLDLQLLLPFFVHAALLHNSDIQQRYRRVTRLTRSYRSYYGYRFRRLQVFKEVRGFNLNREDTWVAQGY